MTKALLVVDVQNDFCEGGSLAVTGGHAVAAGVTELLRGDHGYTLVVASRDWHDADSANGGHFDEWPVHCVADTAGADYAPGFDSGLVDIHIRKGQGRPAYSAFEGTAHDGRTLSQVLRDAGVDELDVCGIATDYCVRASSLDARAEGLEVRLLPGLHAGVAPETSEQAIAELVEAGVRTP